MAKAKKMLVDRVIPYCTKNSAFLVKVIGIVGVIQGIIEFLSLISRARRQQFHVYVENLPENTRGYVRQHMDPDQTGMIDCFKMVYCSGLLLLGLKMNSYVLMVPWLYVAGLQVVTQALSLLQMTLLVMVSGEWRSILIIFLFIFLWVVYCASWLIVVYYFKFVLKG